MTWTCLAASQFAQHVPQWNALQGATTNTPFLESAFIAPLLAVFGTGQEWLALHHRDGVLDAAALVHPLGGGRWETFQPSQLPLGAWVCAADADLNRLASTLLTSLPGLALSLGLTQLDPRLCPRPQANKSLRLQEYVNTSYIDITGSYDAYWEARGKNLKQNTRKQRNKLATDNIVARLDCVDNAADLPQALAQYGALEAAGWKAGTGTAITADNDQGRFYAQMLTNFCAQGRARVVRYWFDDRVVAMDLCIDNGPLVVILKTAYDESLKQVSPSVLMRCEEFKAWWDEGRYQRIEFYGKTMEWHTRWTSDERSLYHATVYRWPWVSRAREVVLSWRGRGTAASSADAAPAVPGLKAPAVPAPKAPAAPLETTG